MGVLESLHIVIAWLLYYLTIRFIRKDNKEKVHLLVLGVFGLIMLIVQAYEILLPIFFGYAWETFYILRTTYGDFVGFFLLIGVIVAILCSLGLFTKFREKHWLGKWQLVLMLSYVLIGISGLTLGRADFATSITPGWHTTIIIGGSYMMIGVWLVLAFLVDFVVTKTIAWASARA